MAITEIRPETSVRSAPDAASGRSPLVPRIVRTAKTAGERAKNAATSLLNGKRKPPPVDRTERALSFLPPQAQAEVWGRFGDFDEHDERAVEPVRETHDAARLNHDLFQGFTETAIVNARHKRRIPYSHVLGLRPDGRQRVKYYLESRGLESATGGTQDDIHIRRALKVIFDREDLDPEQKAALAADSQKRFEDATIRNHLSILTERAAKEAARKRSNAS